MRKMDEKEREQKCQVETYMKVHELSTALAKSHCEEKDRKIEVLKGQNKQLLKQKKEMEKEMKEMK